MRHPPAAIWLIEEVIRLPSLRCTALCRCGGAAGREFTRCYGTAVLVSQTVKLMTLTRCCLKSGDVPKSPLPKNKGHLEK